MSSIHFRWVYHHYCAMLMAVVSLTWDIKGRHPHCEEKQVRRLIYFRIYLYAVHSEHTKFEGSNMF